MQGIHKVPLPFGSPEEFVWVQLPKEASSKEIKKQIRKLLERLVLLVLKLCKQSFLFHVYKIQEQHTTAHLIHTNSYYIGTSQDWIALKLHGHGLT